MEPDRRGHTLCKSNHGQGMNCMNGPGCNLAAGNYRCPLARGDAVSAAAGSRRVKECGGVERAPTTSHQPSARLLPFPPAARHRPAHCRHSNGSSAVAGRAAPPRAAAHRAVARRINKSVSRWALQSEEGGLHTHSLYMET